MWSNRNNQLHSNAGILAMAKHAEVDTSITASIALGPAGMTTHTRHFLFVPLITITRYSIPLMEQCLASVNLGRKTFTLDLQQAAPFSQEAAFMRNWQESLQQKPQVSSSFPPFHIYFRIQCSTLKSCSTTSSLDLLIEATLQSLNTD